MKELSIEEKAKRYDEALEQLRKMMPNWENLSYNGKTFLQDLVYIIPELKESEDEKIRKEIISAIKEDWPGHTDWIAWLEAQGKQKSADGPKKVEGKLKKITFPGWREEDEIYVKTIKSIIYYNCDTEVASGAIIWLESLKDRVVPQPQQEWSEEDKQKIDRIYSILTEAADTHAFSTSCRLIGDKECIELQNFLKSLKDRYTWKPSDEQMFDLKCVADSNTDVLLGQSLLSLYNDLKKLKEG